jgi:dTMP kinase
LTPEKGLERLRKGQFLGEDWNRLDAMELDFHRRVYDGYEKIINADESRFLRINADDSPENITQIILRQLRPKLPALKETEAE